MARPSSDPLIEPATSFSSPLFGTHPHGYNFFIKFYPYGIGPATGKCASILFTLFPGDYDNFLEWPFTKIIHIGIRDQLDPMNTWMKTIKPDQDPAYKKPTMTTKTGVATILINKFIPHSKLFSETEGFLIDGASFIAFLRINFLTLLSWNLTPKLPSFSFFCRAPHSFSIPFERGELSRYAYHSNVNLLKHDWLIKANLLRGCCCRIRKAGETNIPMKLHKYILQKILTRAFFYWLLLLQTKIHGCYKPFSYWLHETAACCYSGVDLGKGLDHNSLSRSADGTLYSSSDLPYLFTWLFFSLLLGQIILSPSPFLPFSSWTKIF